MRKQNDAPKTMRSPLLSPLIGDRRLPELPPETARQKFGDYDSPAGKSGIKVLFFAGCMGDKVYPNVTEACLKIFRARGVGVRMPSSLACCGIPGTRLRRRGIIQKNAFLQSFEIGRRKVRLRGHRVRIVHGDHRKILAAIRRGQTKGAGRAHSRKNPRHLRVRSGRSRHRARKGSGGSEGESHVPRFLPPCQIARGAEPAAKARGGESRVRARGNARTRQVLRLRGELHAHALRAVEENRRAQARQHSSQRRGNRGVPDVRLA